MIIKSWVDTTQNRLSFHYHFLRMQVKEVSAKVKEECNITWKTPVDCTALWHNSSF